MKRKQYNSKSLLAHYQESRLMTIHTIRCFLALQLFSDLSYADQWLIIVDYDDSISQQFPP